MRRHQLLQSAIVFVTHVEHPPAWSRLCLDDDDGVASLLSSRPPLAAHPAPEPECALGVVSEAASQRGHGSLTVVGRASRSDRQPMSPTFPGREKPDVPVRIRHLTIPRIERRKVAPAANPSRFSRGDRYEPQTISVRGHREQCRGVIRKDRGTRTQHF